MYQYNKQKENDVLIIRVFYDEKNMTYEKSFKVTSKAQMRMNIYTMELHRVVQFTRMR